MDMPFINDVWGEEDMFAIEGGITSGLSSPVLSSPSSPIRHLAVTKGSSSPYPPSSSAFASACIAVGSMDDPSSSTSPVSASPPASPSLVKRPLFVGSSTDGNGFQVTTHVHEAASAHDPKSDAMLDGPVVVEMDYMEEEQGEEENGIGDSKRLHGDKARQNGESEAGAAKSEPAAKNARRTTNEAGGGEGKASEDALLGASKKGAESMEVDDISRELTTARSDDGHDHQHLSSSSAPVSVPPLDAHSTTTDVRSTTVEKVESRQPQIETGETPAETLSSIHQLGATVLPPPPALPLAPQLLTTASTTPPATTSAPQVPTAAPPLAEPVAAPATPTATRSKTSAATASTKKSPTTPKAPVSKTVTLRVNTDREDFKRFASMTRDKLRQELKVRGLSVSGTKTDLYQRIVEAILVQEQRDKGVVGVVSNVKVGKVTAKGVGVKGRGKGRKQSRPDTAADEDEDDIEAGKGKKSAGFVFPVPSASASASGSSSAPFTPFSPFAPPVSSGFAVPLSQGQAVMARKEAADSDLLSLDFNDEDALDIPLEESLMEELRKQEEREQKMGMGMAVGRGDDAEYRYRNEEERDDEDDSDSSDDMSSQDDEEEEDDLADDEERAVGGGGKIGSRSAVVRRSHRSHHAPKDELGETAMRRKENEEGLQEASKLTDIVLVNDKIPKHLRTDDRYYYCKHCDRAWPKTSFRNAQQFGAHCSNCARRQIRRTPSLPGTRTLGSPVVPAVDSLRRLSVGRLPQRRPDDASPSLKSSRDLSNSGTRKLAKISIQPMTLGRMKAENRGVFLWFDALPTDLIVRILSFLESSPRDLGAISASCHFFSIIAANDALWRRMFEARWGTDLASRYSGTWRERFASRVSFLKAKATLPPALPSPTAVANVSEEEAGKLKEAWNGLLADPKLKARTVEAVLAVSQAEAADATNAGAPAPAGSTHYLVQWAPADDNDSSAPEERQRWVSEETMTVAPVVTLAGCSSALLGSRKRRASDYALSRDGSSKRLRRPGGSDDDSSDSDDDGVAGFGDLNDLDRKRKRRLLEDESDDDDADDRSDDDSLLGEDSLDGLTNPMAATAAAADAQQQQLRRKFEEGPGAKEARLKRKQLLREKEERARKRRRKGRRGGQDGAGGADDASMNGANNDDVPLTKEDKERQQREFLRVLYNNRDYKPVILFFDRNA